MSRMLSGTQRESPFAAIMQAWLVNGIACEQQHAMSFCHVLQVSSDSRHLIISDPIY